MVLFGIAGTPFATISYCLSSYLNTAQIARKMPATFLADLLFSDEQFFLVRRYFIKEFIIYVYVYVKGFILQWVR